MYILGTIPQFFFQSIDLWDSRWNVRVVVFPKKNCQRTSLLFVQHHVTTMTCGSNSHRLLKDGAWLWVIWPCQIMWHFAISNTPMTMFILNKAPSSLASNMSTFLSFNVVESCFPNAESLKNASWAYLDDLEWPQLPFRVVAVITSITSLL